MGQFPKPHVAPCLTRGPAVLWPHRRKAKPRIKSGVTKRGQREDHLNEKGRPRRTALSNSFVRPKLARIEFDDQVRFHLHRIGHFVERRDAREGDLGSAVGGDVLWDVTLSEALRFDNEGHFLRLVA